MLLRFVEYSTHGFSVSIVLAQGFRKFGCLVLPRLVRDLLLLKWPV